MSSAAAGIKVGLSKEEPEPDNPQPEPGKEEEKPKEEEPKEEEKPNGLSAGAIAGIAVAGVIVIVVASVVSYLIYFRSKKCENGSTIKNEEEVVQKELKSKLLKELKSKLLEKGADETDASSFVNALMQCTVERLNDEIVEDSSSFLLHLALLVTGCGKNDSCTSYLASLVNWCDCASGIPYLAALVKEFSISDIARLAALVKECGKNSCLPSLAALVNECGKNSCIPYLAALVKECNAAKLAALVKECNTSKIIARLATLISNNGHVAGTLAERLNNDNDNAFAKMLVQELNKKEFDVKNVWKMLPINNMNSSLTNNN